jgi:hypothetical protein
MSMLATLVQWTAFGQHRATRAFIEPGDAVAFSCFV